MNKYVRSYPYIYQSKSKRSEIITFTLELTALACTLAIVTLLAIALQ